MRGVIADDDLEMQEAEYLIDDTKEFLGRNIETVKDFSQIEARNHSCMLK